jgi:mannose-6-phosphate isomerase-like protein (cupin superfamily)
MAGWMREVSEVTVEKVNLARKFDRIHEYWSPKIAAQLNGQYLKLAKFKGEFVWHHHEREDELFLVTKGNLTIQFRDGDVTLGEGEFIVVPAGVDHHPVAAKEVQAILLEPISTVNTGNVRGERTIEKLDWI